MTPPRLQDVSSSGIKVVNVPLPNWVVSKSAAHDKGAGNIASVGETFEMNHVDDIEVPDEAEEGEEGEDDDGISEGGSWGEKGG